VRAQDTVAPTPPGASTQVVEVKQVKNPAMMPYRQAYDLLSKVNDGRAHHLNTIFRVTSPQSHVAISGLSIEIVGENTHLKVPVSASGLVDLPVNLAAVTDDADIIANKPKTDLEVHFFIVPDLPAGRISYAELADSVLAARSALGRVVPWYARLLMSSINGIGLCYPEDGHKVSIEGTPEKTRAAREPVQNAVGNKVFCAKFSASEALAQRTGVAAPDLGWEAVFW